MPANKKPRKAYRPKPVALFTLDHAREGVKRLTEEQLQVVRDGVDSAVRKVFAGTAPDLNIRVIADALNMACSFNDVGFRVDPAILNAGLRAIKTICERDTWATRHEEREAILTAVAAHHAQMRSGMTVGDYEKALNLTKRRLAAYQAGNAPAGHITVYGDLAKKAA